MISIMSEGLAQSRRVNAAVVPLSLFLLALIPICGHLLWCTHERGGRIKSTTNLRILYNMTSECRSSAVVIIFIGTHTHLRAFVMVRARAGRQDQVDHQSRGPRRTHRPEVNVSQNGYGVDHQSANSLQPD